MSKTKLNPVAMMEKYKYEIAQEMGLNHRMKKRKKTPK